jgi:REP element-mobilizing transposase RayT
MDRYWLITWTTYGTWLAGDDRGFVSNVYSDDGGPEVRHNSPGTDCDSSVTGLEMYVRDRMLDDPFHLSEQQANTLISQFQETSRIRKYELCTASIMYNHMHLLIGVPGDPDPHRLRELFKSWATRALLKQWKLPKSGEFWTAKGSVRKKEGDAIPTAAIYVARKQPNPLATYIGENWLPVIADYDRRKAMEESLR